MGCQPTSAERVWVARVTNVPRPGSVWTIPREAIALIARPMVTGLAPRVRESERVDGSGAPGVAASTRWVR